MATFSLSVESIGYSRQVMCRAKCGNLCADSEANSSRRNVSWSGKRKKKKNKERDREWLRGGQWGKTKMRQANDAKWNVWNWKWNAKASKSWVEWGRAGAGSPVEEQLTSWGVSAEWRRRAEAGTQWVHKTKRRKWKIISAINDHVISAWNLQAGHSSFPLLPALLPHNVCAGT